MSINVTDLKTYVIEPTLEYMAPEVLVTKQALQLILGTAAKESDLGFWLDQTTPGAGPAFGIYQMEQITYYDNLNWMLLHHKGLFEKAMSLGGSSLGRGAARMHGNLEFATFMARVHYFRRPAALSLTLAGQAAYWKKYYNTTLGAGTTAQYISAYNRLVGAAGGTFV